MGKRKTDVSWVIHGPEVTRIAKTYVRAPGAGRSSVSCPPGPRTRKYHRELSLAGLLVLAEKIKDKKRKPTRVFRRSRDGRLVRRHLIECEKADASGPRI